MRRYDRTLYGLAFLFLVMLGLMHFSASAQIRYDSQSTTTNSSCSPGKACQVMAIPGAQVSMCTASGVGLVNTSGKAVTWSSGPTFSMSWTGQIQISGKLYTIQSVNSSTSITLASSAGDQANATYSSLALCLANPLITYSDYTGNTQCSSTAQITPATGGACVSTSDNQGAFGAWFVPQVAYYYLRIPVSAGGGIYGPFPFSFGATGQSSAVTYSYPASSVTRTVGQKLQETPSILDFGANCNGSADMGPSFQAAINAIPQGSALTVPITNCVMKTGVTISKPLSISAGATSPPSSPQMAQGTDGMTMFTVAPGGSGTTFSGFSVIPGAHTGGTAFSIGNTSPEVANIHFDHMNIGGSSGSFLRALQLGADLFTDFNNSEIHMSSNGVDTNVIGINATGDSSVIKIDHSSFFMGQSVPALAIIVSNSSTATITASDFECGSQIAVNNTNGVLIESSNFENVGGSCPSMASSPYISLGAPFGQVSSNASVISANLFNLGAGIAVQVGDAQGVNMTGNRCRTSVNCMQVSTINSAGSSVTNCTVASTMVCTVPVAPATGQSILLSGFINTGGHDWTGANGTWQATNLSSTTFSISPSTSPTSFNSSALVTFAGQSPTLNSYAMNTGINFDSSNTSDTLTDAQMIGFDSGYNDTTASNITNQVWGAWRFPYTMQPPKPSHIPAGNGTLYWATLDGTSSTVGSFRGLWNNNGTSVATLPLFDFEAFALASFDYSVINGVLKILPFGSTKTNPVAGYAELALTNGAHNSYAIQDDAAGSQCGVAFAFCFIGDNSQKIVFKNPLVAASAAGTVAAGQISYGSTVVASSNCGSLSGAAGCIVINVAGTTRYVPFY